MDGRCVTAVCWGE